MALVSIGPVTVNHGNPVFGTSASPTGHGIESVTISGTCSWDASKTLRGLVKNQDNRTTIAGRTGVLEWLVFDDDMLDDLTGYYLLEDMGRDADHRSSLNTTDVPFSISGAFLGDVA